MMAGFSYAPQGFAMCNGQFLPINQNQALFSLLGTMYGGNGQTTFALPDMRGRTPIGFASSADAGWQPGVTALGERGGAESVALAPAELAQHTHFVQASTALGNSRLPTSRMYARNTSTGTPPAVYGSGNGPLVGMHASSVTTQGGSQPHTNMQPYLAINFCIALTGIFPSQN